MTKPKQERRKHSRYDTEVEVYFRVNYDIKTKVKYQVVDEEENPQSRKYSALSRNVSAEGLCFTSAHKLNKGDMLHIEVYLPKKKEPINMDGEVRWSAYIPVRSKEKDKYDTGVKLTTVNGEPVEESIYADREHRVIWSSVLESVLGNFRILAQERKKS